MSAEKLVYSVEEAAALLGISRAGAYDACARGEIPCIRIGRRVLIPKSALHQLVEKAASDDTAAGPRSGL